MPTPTQAKGRLSFYSYDPTSTPPQNASWMRSELERRLPDLQTAISRLQSDLDWQRSVHGAAMARRNPALAAGTLSPTQQAAVRLAYIRLFITLLTPAASANPTTFGEAQATLAGVTSAAVDYLELLRRELHQDGVTSSQMARSGYMPTAVISQPSGRQSLASSPLAGGAGPRLRI